MLELGTAGKKKEMLARTINLAWPHTYMLACMHACMHACIHTYIHACIHTYMHACIHTYIHACIQVETFYSPQKGPGNCTRPLSSALGAEILAVRTVLGGPTTPEAKV